MLLSFCYVAVVRVLQFLVRRFRSTHNKESEIVVLRHELAILRRQIARPTIRTAGRAFLAAASRLLPHHMVVVHRYSDATIQIAVSHAYGGDNENATMQMCEVR